jgi:nucleoside-diphosphate-sugar epimerase
MAERPVVLITGASGLIGLRLVRHLAPEYTVVGLDLEMPSGDLPDEATFLECDLTSDESTREAIEQARERFGSDLASVVHLAAYYDFSGEPSPLYDELTVQGTRRLLVALREAQLRVEQFVFSSSLLVMQPAEEGEQLTERSPVQAEWDYPQSKLDAEAVIEKERGDIPTVVLRLAGIYDEGGHSPPLTQQIWRIRERKLESFLFPGDRSHGQSFIHLDDAVACIRAVIEKRRELASTELFLVGEPEVVPYGDLQDRIGELLHGREWPTIRIPAPVAKAGAWIKDRTPLGEDEVFIKPWMIDLADAHYPVSIERAEEKLDWRPEHRLSDVLPDMIGKLRADPESWYRDNDLPRDASG